MTDRSLGRCPSVLGMIARLCRVQVCTRPSTGSLWPVAFQTGLEPLKESRASRVQACTRPSTRSLVGPMASDEHVLKQTALTPSFARGSRLQTTPKGRKEQATCQGPPGQPERTSCAVKRMAIKGRPLPSCPSRPTTDRR